MPLLNEWRRRVVAYVFDSHAYSTTEILRRNLSAAKRAPIRPETAFESVFSVNPTLSGSINDEITTPSLPGPANIHTITNLLFFDPITPQTLESALKVRDLESRKEYNENLFDEPTLGTWVLLFYFIYLQLNIHFYYPRKSRVNLTG